MKHHPWINPDLPARSVAQHQAAIAATFAPLAPVKQELLLSAGQVLAEELHAPGPLPSRDEAAMDGFACRLEELLQLKHLPVTHALVPASTTYVLPTGAAMRIMTGAPLPRGADLVIPYEDTREGFTGETLTLAEDIDPKQLTAGKHIRRAGEDITTGQSILPAGTTMTPTTIGLCAGMVLEHIPVYPKPRVTIIPTGSELAFRPDINGPTLQTLFTQLGAHARIAPFAPDEPGLLQQRLSQAATDADLLITTGGLSALDHEVVGQTLKNFAAAEFLGRVAMHPGSPQAVGHWDEVPLLAFPGNPVGAWVSALLFGVSALNALTASTGYSLLRTTATLNSPLLKLGQRYYAGVLETDGSITPCPPGSHRIGAIRHANALIEVELFAPIEAGTTVSVLVLP